MDLMDQFEYESCEKGAIYSDEFKDYIVEYSGRGEGVYNQFHPNCVQRVNSRFAVMYIKTEIGLVTEGLISYSSVPKLFGLLDTSSMEQSGVLRLRRQPYLGLFGSDILLGFVDTGIEYTHSSFKNADNTTRITAIWDQTVENGTPPKGLLYGQEYTQEMINAALQSENPLEIVPSTDENGHGTFMAGIAAGNNDTDYDFTGVAPQSNIIMVKLKQVKPDLRDFYRVPFDVEAYTESDIMLGVRYLLLKAAELQRPIVICIGVGTNSGNHDGKLPISLFLEDISTTIGVAVIIAAGNEANARHHYQGNNQGNLVDDVELKVADNERGFALELWARAPNMISVGFTSPYGEVIRGIPMRGGRGQRINFVFENTEIIVNYAIVEYYTGGEVILMRFHDPTPGIWRIEVYNDSDYKGPHNMWLPMEHFISSETYFLKPNPDITLCEPGNSDIPVVVSTYNHKTNSIYINSSRGYTITGNIKPNLAAPGVEVYGPTLNGEFGNKSGSSIAAAHTAGVAALLMEWGIIQGHAVEMNTVQIKNFLIKGARREEMVYPNREWGYGSLDVYKVFESLRFTL